MNSILEKLKNLFGAESKRTLSLDKPEYILVDTLFQLAAKVVAADGTISNEELNYINLFAKDSFRLEEGLEALALEAFDKGLREEEELPDLALKIKKQGVDSLLLEIVVDILVQVSVSDGDYAKEEEQVIKAVASNLGLSTKLVDKLRYHYSDADNNLGSKESENRGPLSDSGATCLKMLGLSWPVDAEEVLEAWRELDRKYSSALKSESFPEVFNYYASNKRERLEQAHKIVLSEL